MIWQWKNKSMFPVMIYILSLIVVMAVTPAAMARIIESPGGTPGGSEGDPLDSNDYAGGSDGHGLVESSGFIGSDAVDSGNRFKPIFFNSTHIFVRLKLVPGCQPVLLILPTPERWKLVEARYAK